MKIVTVTPNPAIDRTLWVDRIEPGTLHRVRRSQSTVSGKGINVSLALKQWGVDSVVLALAGGETGRKIAAELSARGIEHDLVTCPGETRTNVKVIEEPTGRLSEFNEAGPHVDEAVLAAFERKLAEHAAGADAVIISGSFPPGATPATARRLVEVARQAGAFTLLDTSGEPLKEGLAGRPHALKPNQVEIEALLGQRVDKPGERLAAVRRLLDQGIDEVVLSLGAEGAVFGSQDGVLWARTPPIASANPVGCGDVLVAALIYTRFRSRVYARPDTHVDTRGDTQTDTPAERLSWAERARFSVSAAAAAAARQGGEFPDLAGVRRFLPEVVLAELV